MAFPAAQLSQHEWILILFFIDENPSRAAFRVASTHQNNAGEAARISVEGRIAAVEGTQPPFELMYRRMCWWTPWVGCHRILSPPLDHGQVALAHWQALVAVQSQGMVGQHHGRLFICVHMNSHEWIRHRSYCRGGWVSRYAVWIGMRLGQLMCRSKDAESF